MNRRRQATVVVLAGLVGAGIAELADPGGDVGVLMLFAAGIALGELLVFVLPDGSSLPLSYSVLLVVASSFGLVQYGAAFAGAELFAIVVLRVRDSKPWYLRLSLRVAVAAATFAVWRIGFDHVSKHEDVGAILLVLGAAALAQVVVDALLRALFGWSSALAPRGRFMWIALTASGMLMAIGYRGVDRGAGHTGGVGGWTPLLAGPLLATWYASERLAGATRAYVQTNEALAMAPELAGMVPAGHAERVRVLVARSAVRWVFPRAIFPISRPRPCCITSAKLRSTNRWMRWARPRPRSASSPRRCCARSPCSKRPATSWPATATIPRRGSRRKCCDVRASTTC